MRHQQESEGECKRFAFERCFFQTHHEVETKACQRLKESESESSWSGLGFILEEGQRRLISPQRLSGQIVLRETHQNNSDPLLTVHTPHPSSNITLLLESFSTSPPPLQHTIVAVERDELIDRGDTKAGHSELPAARHDRRLALREHPGPVTKRDSCACVTPTPP